MFSPLQVWISSYWNISISYGLTVWLPIRREKNIKSQRIALLEYLHCDFIRSLKPSWLAWWYSCQEGLGLFSNMAGLSLQKPLIRSMLETVLLVAELNCAHLSYLGTGSQLYFSSWPMAILSLLPCRIGAVCVQEGVWGGLWALLRPQRVPHHSIQPTGLLICQNNKTCFIVLFHFKS